MKKQYLVHIERIKNKKDREDIMDRQANILQYLDKHNPLELSPNTYLLSTEEHIFDIKDVLRGFINGNYSLLTSTIIVENIFCLRPDIKLWVDSNVDIDSAKLSMDGC